MYDENLISYLNNELNDLVEIDKSKMRTDSQYFKLYDKKKQKLLDDYDFTEISFPEQYLTLTTEQKESIKEFVRVFCQDSNDFEAYLRLVCRVGYCYEKADLNGTQEYNTILENYQYLKQLWKERYQNEFDEFENLKRECVIETNQQPQLRPNCLRCNSSKIVSNGLNWYCKSCGKQWVKHPQKKRIIIN